MQFLTANADRIAIENPVGFMNTAFRSPDQIIHPYMFAESVDDTENYVTKATCLWLVNLPKLKTNGLPKPDNGKLLANCLAAKIAPGWIPIAGVRRLEAELLPALATQ